ncbi:MAG: hypothetical protein AAF266_05520 [Planctomycetota bacterium]
MFTRLVSHAGCVALSLVLCAVTSAAPVDVGNFSFETPLNSNPSGLYGSLNNTQVWTGDATGLHGFGFADLVADDGQQNVSLRQGAVLTQEQNGGTIDGFTKASIPLPALNVGDEITFTAAYALRDNSAIEWADSSYIALYDSATFNLADPLGTALATSGFLSEPAARAVWEDEVLTYTITGNEGGFLGLYLRGEHLGPITGAGPANHQTFFDNIRLDVPPVAILAGDVDLDGDVDIDDFAVIRDNFLTNVNTRAEGDLNGDDRVDFADFQQVVDNFPFPPGEGVESLLQQLSVPEPGAVLLACLASVIAMPVRRRVAR